MAVADLKKMHNVQFFLQNVCNMSGLFFWKKKSNHRLGEPNEVLLHCRSHSNRCQFTVTFLHPADLTDILLIGQRHKYPHSEALLALRQSALLLCRIMQGAAHGTHKPTLLSSATTPG